MSDTREQNNTTYEDDRTPDLSTGDQNAEKLQRLIESASFDIQKTLHVLKANVQAILGDAHANVEIIVSQPQQNDESVTLEVRTSARSNGPRQVFAGPAGQRHDDDFYRP